MIQKTLFDTPAKLSRKSDKLTSQKSAAEIERSLGLLQERCMIVLRISRVALTANEIADRAARTYGKQSESYRKRLHELVEKGHAIESGERSCEVTGKTATTYTARQVSND
jgi:hypothetical protein